MAGCYSLDTDFPPKDHVFKTWFLPLVLVEETGPMKGSPIGRKLCYFQHVLQRNKGILWVLGSYEMTVSEEGISVGKHGLQ